MKKEQEAFPVMFPYAWMPKGDARIAAQMGCPRSIPWSLIRRHEKQVQRNHYQSAARLAERGGLAPSEAVAVLEDREWCHMSIESAVTQLKELLNGSKR